MAVFRKERAAHRRTTKTHTTPYTSYLPLEHLNNALFIHIVFTWLIHILFGVHMAYSYVKVNHPRLGLTQPCEQHMVDSHVKVNHPGLGLHLLTAPVSSSFSPSLGWLTFIQSLTHRLTESLVFSVPDNSATLWSRVKDDLLVQEDIFNRELYPIASEMPGNLPQ